MKKIISSILILSIIISAIVLPQSGMAAEKKLKVDKYGFIVPVEKMPEPNEDGFISKVDVPDPNAVVIYDIDGLRNIKNNLSGSYVLGCDIDFSSAEYDWEPIGNYETPFTGVFDGQGYKINKFCLSQENRSGIFGYVAKATIKNVGLSVPSAKTTNGGLISGGSSFNNIDNCFLRGDNSGCSICYMTGSRNKVKNCYVMGNVNDAKVGYLSCNAGIGYIGRNGEVVNCFVKGDITAKDSVAGLVFVSDSEQSTISNCFFEGNINVDDTAGSYIGGLVASYDFDMGWGMIDNCYVIANITAVSDERTYGSTANTAYVSALGGYRCTNSYYMGNISVNDYSGIVIRPLTWSKAIDSYYITSIDGKVSKYESFKEMGYDREIRINTPTAENECYYSINKLLKDKDNWFEINPDDIEIIFSGLKINGSDLCTVNNEVTLNATRYDENGNVAPEGGITWSCSNESLAKITPNGNKVMVKGLKGGKVTITATHKASGMSATHVITVEDSEFSISLQGGYDLKVDEEIEIHYGIMEIEGRKKVDLDDLDIEWEIESDGEEPIRIVRTNKGAYTHALVVKGVEPGKCTLIMKIDGKEVASTEIEVLDEITVYVNDKEVEFKNKPIQTDKGVYLDVSALVKAMKAKFYWNSELYSGLIVMPDRMTVLEYLNTSALVAKSGDTDDWKRYTYDDLVIKDGVKYIPIDAIETCLGADMDWDEDKLLVDITTKKKENTITKEDVSVINAYYSSKVKASDFVDYSDNIDEFYDSRGSNVDDAFIMFWDDWWLGVKSMVSGDDNDVYMLKLAFAQLLAELPNNNGDLRDSIYKETADAITNAQSKVASGASLIEYINFAKVSGKLSAQTADLMTQFGKAMGDAGVYIEVATETIDSISFMLSDYVAGVSYIETIRSSLESAGLDDDEIYEALDDLKWDYTNKYIAGLKKFVSGSRVVISKELMSIITSGTLGVAEFAKDIANSLVGNKDKAEAVRNIHSIYCFNYAIDRAYKNVRNNVYKKPETVYEYIKLFNFQKVTKIKMYEAMDQLRKKSDSYTKEVIDDALSDLKDTSMIVFGNSVLSDSNLSTGGIALGTGFEDSETETQSNKTTSVKSFNALTEYMGKANEFLDDGRIVYTGSDVAVIRSGETVFEIQNGDIVTEKRTSRTINEDSILNGLKYVNVYTDDVEFTLDNSSILLMDNDRFFAVETSGRVKGAIDFDSDDGYYEVEALENNVEVTIIYERFSSKTDFFGTTATGTLNKGESLEIFYEDGQTYYDSKPQKMFDIVTYNSKGKKTYKNVHMSYDGTLEDYDADEFLKELEKEQPKVNNGKFSDVSSYSSYAEAVGEMAKRGIITGYEDGTFRPDNSVTRAEAAAMIVRMMGKADKVKKGRTIFSDVDKEHWASGYVNSAVADGIINGMGDGTFRPSGTLTYEQIIKMIVCALGEKELAESNGGWDGGGYFYAAAKIGFSKGVVGTSSAPASRATVARLIYNAISLSEAETEEGEVPDLAIDSYDSETDEDTVTITGKVTDETGDITLTCEGEKVTVKSTGKFSVKLELEEGSNSFKFVAKNEYGSTSKTVKIKLEEEETTPVYDLGKACYISPKNASKSVLDVYGGNWSKDWGTDIVLWTYGNSDYASRQFKFVHVKDGWYKIVSVNTNYVLHANCDTMQVITYPYHGDSNQLWKLEDAGSGYYYMRMGKDIDGKSYYLSVKDSETGDGTKIVVAPLTKGNNQKFSIRIAPTTIYSE